jgi:hypothetical protein
VAKTLSLTWQGAKDAIDTLVDLGILAPSDHPRRGTTTYVAPAVLDVLLA